MPENWISAKMGDVVEVVMGQSPNGENTTDDDSFIGLIGGAADMGETLPEVSRYTTKPTKISKDGDVILCVRATLGRPIFSDGEYCLGRGVAALRSNHISKEFIRFFIIDSEDYFTGIAKGTTFSQINKTDLQNHKIPLPPFAEQRRIVAHIESLFEKLDRAKALVQSALDSFENRKAAILHKAFTGELTAKWRKENGVELDSWEDKELNQVMDVRDGTHDSPQFHQQGFPLITSKNLKNGLLSFDNVKFISQEDYNKINLRSKVNVNDILFAMIGTIGNPIVIIEEPMYAIKNVALFKSIGKINSRFVSYFFESKAAKDKIDRDARGSTQRFVSLGYLRAFPLTVPSSPEQTEIVRILDSLLENEKTARELSGTVEKIDHMKKAILARAFRGKLGTNDPSEASVAESIGG